MLRAFKKRRIEMERKNNIGFRRGSSLLALSSLLLASLMLLLAQSAIAADKLVVKDAAGTNTKFLVTDEGKVGIGTQSPAAQLSIANEEFTPFRGLMITQSSSNAQSAPAFFLKSRGTVLSPADVSSGDYIGNLGFRGYSNGSYIQTILFGARITGAVTSTSIDSDFYISNSLTHDVDPYTNGTIRLMIKSNGNIGVGTTNPQGKLDVNGAIYQRGGVLHADYVFEPAYKIESIEEHAQYMWKNKHLQAISGVKKDENGLEIIEVGAQQRGIVEELEKAHVYIEQLNAKIEALEAKLRTIQDKK
jgi:hypothetical protein